MKRISPSSVDAALPGPRLRSWPSPMGRPGLLRCCQCGPACLLRTLGRLTASRAETAGMRGEAPYSKSLQKSSSVMPNCLRIS
jgi:hypothetical protein